MRFLLKYPPGIVTDDTTLAKGGRYVDASMVRFVRGQPETVNGWERVFRTSLEGVCRNSLTWIDNAGRVNLAFGTHTNLYVWRGGQLIDITPALARPSQTLGTDPLSVANGDATVTVTMPGHGLADGALITVTGAAAVGGITPNRASTAVTVIDADSFSYEFTSNATGTATGGGSAVVIAPQEAFAAGQINGTGGSGYGTGAYGVGQYGQPSAAEYYPRTWSLTTLGQALVASPRGGAIYIWDNDSAVKALPIANSPRQCTAVIVTPERAVMALGCNEEVSGTFNPRVIRHSSLTDETVWSTTAAQSTANEITLQSEGRIVSGRMAGYAALVWTDNEVIQLSYVGALDQTYRPDTLGSDCGLMGPNACAVQGQRAFWLSPDVRLWTVALGGQPASIESPMRGELEENLVPNQRDKVILSTLNGHSELWMFYPDVRDGLENSRYQCMSITDGWWSKGILARTAFIDAGPSAYPLGVDVSGNVFWHEKGTTADGDAISGHLEAGPQYLDGTERLVLLREFIPDFKSLVGGLELTLKTWEEPQAPVIEWGPYDITANTQAVQLKSLGRLMGWRIEFNSAPASWRLGTPVAEGRDAGKR